MALNSPGVEVQVIDESFYVPAEPGTRPLIIVATKENKLSGSKNGTAVGTLKANAGKPYILSSQRDLADIFGTPLFYTDSSQNPIHGGELNEYGLQAAYSFLGVSNSAWVIRADIDLAQLTQTTVAPNSNPVDGQYWLDTRDTHFGIFEWNSSEPTVSGGQKFVNKIPTVITDETRLEGNDVNGLPLKSIGKIGDYIVVSTTATNKIYFKNKSGNWVQLGSSDWISSNPAVQGTKSNPTLLTSDTMIINGITVTVPGGMDTNIEGLASAITTDNDIPGVSAAKIYGRLEIYGDSTVPGGIITIQKGNGTLVNANVSDSKLGIKAGTYAVPQLSIQSHTNVPLFKRTDNMSKVYGIPSGSVWIKTTNVNLGAHWVVKMWNDAVKEWQTVEAPVYADNQSALYGLDRAGGGRNIARGRVYVQYNVNEKALPTPEATFSLFRRELANPTTVTSVVITNETFHAGIDYGFKIGETTSGSPALNESIDVVFRAGGDAKSDAELIASSINAAGFENIIASVNTRNQVVIIHEAGGDFRISGDIAIESIGGTAAAGGAASIYHSVASIKVTGNGTGARFDVTKTGTSTSYNSSNTVIIADPNNPGSGYKAGDQIKILGTAIGGTTPANDLVFTYKDTLEKFYEGPYNVNLGTGTLNFYAAPANTEYKYIVSSWKPLKAKQSDVVPSQIPLDGRLWYNPSHSADIMVHNGTTWVGYLDHTSPYYVDTLSLQTDPLGPRITATKPTAQSDGSPLNNGDLWLDTGDLENYPALYKYDGFNAKWISIDNSDQTTEDGILFADARYNTNGTNSDTPGDIADLLVSNFLDPDAPDPDLYPRGMLLFNTRRSGNNVKRFVRNHIDINGTNDRYLNGDSQNLYYPHRWVNESGNAPDGRGLFGRYAQRKVVVNKLKALVDTNQLIRDEEIRTFNLIACPGYTELIANMVNLNLDRKQTAFIIGDTPFRLPSDATSINDWGTHAMISAVDNGEEALITRDEYLGVYYPSGMTTDNNGNKIVVPASHMVLRSIALSDGVSFPWFAPAGTRRGKVSNATSVGYIDSATGEWQSISLNEGQRDTLYSVSVNPITELTGSGIVIFGQKTRAANASSLDRINVARLVVYLRGQLSKLAKPYIFEPNDKITRSELKSAAESIMLELIGHRGIYDYLVICDESNNTPSRIDRNELHLDIAIEPMKAVEFIYIPLRLKNTGEIKGL